MANETSVGSIKYDLDLDDSKFRSKSGKVQDEIKSIGKSLEMAEDGSRQFAKGLAVVGTTLIASAGFGVKFAADLETMTQGFVTLLGSTEKAEEAISMIKKDASSTPFELPGLIQANQLLTSVTKDAVQSERFLLNIGKALTAMGKGQPELDRIIVNLQQVGAVGKASLMDIKQFAFAGIPIFEMLKEATGKSGAELEKMISKGQVSFKMLEDMFNKAGEGTGRFSKAFELQGGTFNQVLSNFKDNIGITMGEIVKKTGLFDAVKKALSSVTVAIGELAKPENIQKMVEFFNGMQANLPVIIGLIVGGLVPALWGAVTAFLALMVPLIPFIAAGAAIGFVVKMIIDNWTWLVGLWNSTVAVVSNLWTSIKDAFINGWNAVVTFFTVSIPAFVTSFITFLSALPQMIVDFIWNQIILGFVTFLGFLVGLIIFGIPDLVNKIIEFLMSLPQRVSEILTNVYNFFVSVWNNIKAWLFVNVPLMIAGVMSYMNQLPGKIWTAMLEVKGKVSEGINATWKALIDEVSQWPSRMFEWGKNIMHSFADGIKAAIGAIASAFKEGLNKAKALVEGHSPPLEGPFKNIDQWGFNVGSAWVDGFYNAFNNISIPNVASPAFAGVGMGDNNVNPINQYVNVYVDKVGDMQDIQAIGREIGFRLGIAPK